MLPTPGQGVYTFTEAARLTALKPARVREWFRGRAQGEVRRPVFSSDYEPVGGDHAISFLDLVDVYVAGQLREHGVSLRTVRRVYCRMAEDLQTQHPFGREELLTDGKVVIMRGLDSQGREELTEVLTRQGVFPQILLPFLKRIDYEKVGLLAKRWRIADQVIVDPAICFGQPIIEALGMPTTILAAAFRANGRNAQLVADWYNVQPEHVLAAVRFEGSFAA